MLLPLPLRHNLSYSRKFSLLFISGLDFRVVVDGVS